MHTMRRVVEKSGDLEYATILNSYCNEFLNIILLWEQEVGGSNSLAPTSLRSKRS